MLDAVLVGERIERARSWVANGDDLCASSQFRSDSREMEVSDPAAEDKFLSGALCHPLGCAFCKSLRFSNDVDVRR